MCAVPDLHPTSPVHLPRPSPTYTQKCADVLVGDPLTKGISGGQAKRTNIGIALITSPRVLFLDEPTSGLDSFTSNEVGKGRRGRQVGRDRV